MSNICVFKNCKNHYNKNDSRRISFFKMPHNKKMFDIWAKKINKDLKFSIHSRFLVCEEHFHLSDINHQIVSTKRKGNANKKTLKKGALPRSQTILHFNEDHKDLIPKEASVDNTKEGSVSGHAADVLHTKFEDRTKSNVDMYFMSNAPDSSTLKSGTSVNKDVYFTPNIVVTPLDSGKDAEVISPENKVAEKWHKSTNTNEEFLTDVEALLKKYSHDYQLQELEQYKHLMESFYMHNLRLASRCNTLKLSAERAQSNISRILREASKVVTPHQLSFICAQMLNSTKSAKKRVWSPEMRTIAVGLLRVSRSAYKYLSEIFVLPGEAEVCNWSAKIPKDSTEPSSASSSSESKEEVASEGRGARLSLHEQAIIDQISFENTMATLI